MKKKILVCSYALGIGGVERSLIEMLNCIDYDNYDVDLFLFRHIGAWMNEIPSNVNLLDANKQYWAASSPFKSAIKQKQIFVAVGKLYAKIKANNYAKKHNHNDSMVINDYGQKYVYRFLPKINPKTEYDLAISFLTPHYVVANKVNAKMKIAWIHTDYSFVDIDVKSEIKMWDKYDYIASISEDCTKGFLSKFPKLAKKILPIENLLSEQTVFNRANEQVCVEYDRSSKSTIILTIGRFSYPKRLEDIPEICRKILDAGFNIKWYIIGYGATENLIKQNIEKFDVEDNVIILGKRENPYPYVKHCDIYIQPSRYEGKSVTVREAQMLGKPVIITNYPTASAQLKDGYDGIIVPLELEGCVDEICKFLSNKDLLEIISQNTKKVDYTNKSELEKLYGLMN